MKHLLKRLLCLVLVLALSFIVSIPAFALKKESLNDTEFANENNYITAYVKHMHDTSIYITQDKILKDVNGQRSYLYVTFNTNGLNGYAILNLQDSKIIELSLDHMAPFNINDDIIYSGPLNYLKTNGTNFIDVKTNKIIPLSQLNVSGSIINKSVQQNNTTNLNSVVEVLSTLSSASRRTITGSGSTSWAYSAGSYYGDCGINSIAMIEKWYDLYDSSNYLPSSLSTEFQIKKSIYDTAIARGYSTTLISPTSLASLITLHTQQVGLNYYYLYAYSSSYDWATVCSRIDRDRPTLLATRQNTPTYGRHYIIAVGYTDDGIPSNNQLYINDGWGQYVWLSSSYLQDEILTI